jgi:hypothetical protein
MHSAEKERGSLFNNQVGLVTESLGHTDPREGRSAHRSLDDDIQQSWIASGCSVLESPIEDLFAECPSEQDPVEDELQNNDQLLDHRSFEGQLSAAAVAGDMLTLAELPQSENTSSEVPVVQPVPRPPRPRLVF